MICAGPDTPSSETIRVGGRWISNTDAQIGLLHVITNKRIETNINSSDLAPVSNNLVNQFFQQLRDVGVKNKIVPYIRQGLVVDEVLRELSEGNYQLLVIGAHFQPGQDLWQGTLLDDVTDQLLNRSSCSVLII